jgi:hypothetical protein
MKIDLQIISSGYDRKTCWVHARTAAISVSPAKGIVTTQKLRVSGDDVFYELNEFRSDDGGKSWSGPIPHKDTLGRHPLPDGGEEAICDFTPGWHAKTGVILGTGQNAVYYDDTQRPYPSSRRTCYSVYSPEARTWTPWKKLASPFSEGAGSTQRVDLPDGDVLLPTCWRLDAGAEPLHASTVMRCGFNGITLEYIEHGTELTLPHGRGLVEPSLAFAGGRYFLTLRNNESGYVAVSEDGLRYGTPQKWTFDDGSELGSYNTQQHWVTHLDDLYLVYTRRGANNDHIMRHRAPLFIAQVDKDRLCVIRDTEQIVVPEHGARLCNFGVAKVSENETWISVAEWMQTKLPDPFDCTVCERYGSDNRIFVAKLHF